MWVGEGRAEVTRVGVAMMAEPVTVWMGGGRAEFTRVGVAMTAEPVTVTPQLGPGSPGGGAFVAEAVGYGTRVRTAWGRLGATNSCVPRSANAFGGASHAQAMRLNLHTMRLSG